MKRIAILLAACLVATAASAQDAPFGWATCSSLTTSAGYDLCGGGDGSTVILQSDGADMRADIIKAVKDYDIIVFDGSKGDFLVSSIIDFSRVKSKTLLGVNGARIRTTFEVSDDIRALLDSAGVRRMSSQGGGGELSNGAFVFEERERNTRQSIIDFTGDQSERYRRSGVFSLYGCENWIIRNIAFYGPGTIDVGGADLLTLTAGTNHVWVDHCSFTDGMDGNFDIGGKSDFITVSWCSFAYSERAYDHRVSCLVGSNERPDSQGIDNLNVTYACCLWDKGCDGRMPLVRFGKVHVLNCLYACDGNASPAINARRDSEVLVEGCVFCKDVKPFEPSADAGAWVLRDNVFKCKFTPASTGSVEMPYEYTPMKAAKVRKAVSEGAGPTLDLKAPAQTVVATIHLMGDSTMADKNISGGNPERGWGMVFENFFDPSVRVVNYAKNGRSTKSAIDEGIWDDVKANLREGDYLFIEFGHNDEKLNKPAVGAAAWGAYQDNLRLFVNTAREKGVTPVLLTPVARRAFSDGVLDETTHGEYPAAMKAVAEETGTTLIDMEKATLDWIRAAGDEASRPFFMWVEPGTCAAIPDGRKDNTHSTARGASLNCEIVCDSIRAKLPALASHLVHYDYVVDQQGRGDFLTVQEAIDAVPNYLYKAVTTILVKPGVYREKVIIPTSKCCLKIVGSGADNTVIQWDDHARMKAIGSDNEIGTSGTAAIFVDASFVTFEDLTLRNDAGQGPGIGQAVTVSTSGDGIFFHRCKILGWQDTIYTAGRYGAYGYSARSYYLDCYIEGTTDFVFGPGRVLFENCEIHSLRDSYVTAASTFKGEEYGYVFRNCRLTAAPGVTKVYLGRPWRDFANVVFLECELGSHIRPEGWHNWSKPEREKTAFYAEYKNFGPGADISQRVGWSHQLTDAEAAKYTFDTIMAESGYDDLWNPIDNKEHPDASNYIRK